MLGDDNMTRENCPHMLLDGKCDGPDMITPMPDGKWAAQIPVRYFFDTDSGNVIALVRDDNFNKNNLDAVISGIGCTEAESAAELANNIRAGMRAVLTQRGNERFPDIRVLRACAYLKSRYFDSGCAPPMQCYTENELE